MRNRGITDLNSCTVLREGWPGREDGSRLSALPASLAVDNGNEDYLSSKRLRHRGVYHRGAIVRVLVSLLLALVFVAIPVTSSGVEVYRQSVEAFADVKVYVTDVEAFADCVIYVTDVEAFATGNAKWYWQSVEAFADVEIFFTDVEAFADYKVYFTDVEAFARCDVPWASFH